MIEIISKLHFMNNLTLLGKITQVKCGNIEYQEIIDFILNLNYSKVYIDENKITFHLKDKTFSFNLILTESDLYSDTYNTEILNQKIRVIRPSIITKVETKISNHEFFDNFIFGSLDSDGFAVSFRLTNLDNTENIEIEYIDIIDLTIKKIIEAVPIYYLNSNRAQIEDLVIRLKKALSKKKTNILEYKGGAEAETIFKQFGFYFNDAPPKGLNIVDSFLMNSIHEIPNLTDSFINDLKGNQSKLIRKLNRNLEVNEIVELISNYACELLIEYHTKADGVLPVSIIKQVKSQLTVASYFVFSIEDPVLQILVDLLIDSQIRDPLVIENTSTYFAKLNNFYS